MVREADLQRTILDYLTVHRIFHWRNNSGAVKAGNRFIRYGCVGSPDIFVVTTRHSGCCCQLYGIEVKGPKGKQSVAQLEFERSFKQAGGRYILARKLEDVSALLEWPKVRIPPLALTVWTFRNWVRPTTAKETE
jgi:hypothetical protein